MRLKTRSFLNDIALLNLQVTTLMAKSSKKSSKKGLKQEKIREKSKTSKKVEKTTEIAKKTTEWMTKYEYAKLIACRAMQIAQGDKPLVDINGEYDPLRLAERELLERVIPLVIYRPLPDGTQEIWNPNEMHIRSY